jgi:DNA-binding response OmpR family regulator
LRRSLAFNLEKAGYRVSTAAMGEDGLARARLDPPDLMLLDINLPKMDGLDALRLCWLLDSSMRISRANISKIRYHVRSTIY